jgi:hypothetical protein
MASEVRLASEVVDEDAMALMPPDHVSPAAEQASVSSRSPLLLSLSLVLRCAAGHGPGARGAAEAAACPAGRGASRSSRQGVFFGQAFRCAGLIGLLLRLSRRLSRQDAGAQGDGASAGREWHKAL